MSKKRRKSHHIKKPGLAPGTLIFAGHRSLDIPYLDGWMYNSETLKPLNDSLDENATEEGLNFWYDLRGLHDVDLIQKIGLKFKIHPLGLEDILHPGQRPKFDEFDDGNLIFLTALSFNADNLLVTEQIGIFFKPGLVISFQENESDLFEPIKERFLKEGSRLRQKNSTYLVYALMDLVVDQYFEVLDKIETQIQDLESDISDNENHQFKHHWHLMRGDILLMRKITLPLREVANRLQKLEDPYEADQHYLYIRDLYDHILNITEALETCRESLVGVNDLYQNQINMRTNKIMQVLTIISTIFIPITFIVGVYGMNFRVMPELEWKHGYYAVWGLMIFMAGAMIVYFKKQRWF
ncbi:MAG: magnesium/cobalt transporter CorA [Saprospiraceae bacterium]|nr:magnesium/cobalt transporter CorA [Saprospiraceae bacterium]